MYATSLIDCRRIMYIETCRTERIEFPQHCPFYTFVRIRNPNDYIICVMRRINKVFFLHFMRCPFNNSIRLWRNGTNTAYGVFAFHMRLRGKIKQYHSAGCVRLINMIAFSDSHFCNVDFHFRFASFTEAKQHTSDQYFPCTRTQRKQYGLNFNAKCVT